MSKKAFAAMYAAGKLRGDRDSANPRNSLSEFPGHLGAFLAIRSAAPPDASEYDAWLSLQLAKTRGSTAKVTGAKLRRMVIMRRQGSTFAEIGRAVGLTSVTARNWLIALPEALAA